MLINQDGRAGFVDTKSADSETFAFSSINFEQVEFMAGMGDVCPAGYVICFRPVAEVVFFSWEQLMRVQPNTSLHYSQGKRLGNLGMFHPKFIFDL